ncbi:MAG: (d)CMP kinase, partial [Candidatus Syntrophosphaera sp.]
QKKGVEADLESVNRELAERDRNDKSRELAPLSKAEDAIEIDTSDMRVEEQVDALHEIVKARMEKS